MPKAVQSSFCETETERVFVNGGWAMVLEGEMDLKMEEKRRISVVNHTGEMIYR